MSRANPRQKKIGFRPQRSPAATLVCDVFSQGPSTPTLQFGMFAFLHGPSLATCGRCRLGLLTAFCTKTKSPLQKFQVPQRNTAVCAWPVWFSFAPKACVLSNSHPLQNRWNQATHPATNTHISTLLFHRLAFFHVNGTQCQMPFCFPCRSKSPPTTKLC